MITDSHSNPAVARLAELYKSCTGTDPDSISALSSSGSHRQYFRISGAGREIIGVAGTDPHENMTFCALDRHFSSKGLPVPKILAISKDNMYYLQEDLGSESLFDKIAPGRAAGEYSEEEIKLLEDTISLLPEIQISGAEGLDFSKCYPKESFDRMSVMFDFHYFKYCFLKNAGIDFNEVKLEQDFEKFAGILLGCKDNGFMYRDFQSRNVMIKDGKPYFIDFQDGRHGPLYYDLASFVWQARSAFPDELKKRLIDRYLSVLESRRRIAVAEFMENLRVFVLFRTLQVLGAYGFRGYMERKRHFIDSIPFAVRNLGELLEAPPGSIFEGLGPISDRIGCGYLLSVLKELTELQGLKAIEGGTASEAGEEVVITSFSYRKGIPADDSGNGGGYVFDCRAIHNPGKYDEYKALTGMDAPVKAFLEQNGEVRPFLENVYSLVDAHVAKYLKRGFTHLTVSFGCTGGQHRSVYCAESLAAHLAGRKGLKIKLIHREQNIEKTF